MVRLFETYKLTNNSYKDLYSNMAILFDDHVQEHRIKFSCKPFSNLFHLQGSAFIPKPISMFGSDTTSYFSSVHSIVVTYFQFDSNIRVFYVFLGFKKNT
jgi:hypothetical protein